jgi:SWI/SNF-related matrix-associated actin-dependent regulator 1 of chromatin subfamily A
VKIDLVGQVFVATTADRTEGQRLKALGGWRWHSGACDARFCQANCPAKGVYGWWTTDPSAAERVKGGGVHTAASLAAIEAAKSEKKPVRSPRIEFRGGVFVITDADREESRAIRAASGGDQRWRWHGDACNPEFCRANCPAKGVVSNSWWTTDVELVRPLRAFLGDSARVELDRRDDSLSLSRATSDAKASEIPCPQGKAYLPFQAAGIRYAMSRRCSMIGDEMGLGKTVQAVGVVNADTSARTVLVICPAFLREVWRRHAIEWSVRETRVVVLETAADVAKAKKQDLLTRNGEETLWVVISYSGCRAASSVGKLVHASESLSRIDVLILDESHRTKERDTQQSQGAIALSKRATRILALSGTPIPNRPIELATTLSMLDPKFDFWRFAKRYCAARQTRYGWDMSGASNLAELQRELRETVMIRRLKSDVLRELPKKSWSVVTLPTEGVPAHLVKTSKDESDRAAKARATRVIAEAVGDTESIRIAIEAELAEYAVTFECLSSNRAELGKYKVEGAIKYLEGLTKDECVIVFCHHKSVARAIYDRLGGERHGIYIDGDVDSEERVDRVDQFQGSDDPQFRYVVATIDSAKEGLTITRASRVVFVEQSFTPGTMAQAEDRAHRIGQERSVQVDYLVFDGTIDAYMCRLLVQKQRISAASLDEEHCYDEAQQNNVVLREKPSAEFDAHDPDAYAARARDWQRPERETPEQYAARTADRRGVTTTYQPTAEQIDAVLKGMRLLTADDPDRANVDNGVGFSKSDVYVGHAMARLDTLSPDLWALGATLCKKYRRQLGDDLVEATGMSNL